MEHWKQHPPKQGNRLEQRRAALVDKTLMLQYNAQVGDSIKVGNVSFIIAGTLLKGPGQTGLSTSVAPPVYIPLELPGANWFIAKRQSHKLQVLL
jgi:putative ABC transport system permease protein